ncbi:MAG: hypothetical protein ABIX01_06870 [Chitinophagaceae bacterium]
MSIMVKEHFILVRLTAGRRNSERNKSLPLNSRSNLINATPVFIATIIIVPVLSLIIYLLGFHQHRTLYLNSLISTTILSTVFLSFITAGKWVEAQRPARQPAAQLQTRKPAKTY